MGFGLLSFVILFAIVWHRKFCDATPILTLTGKSEFNIGDNSTLTCAVNEDVDLLSVSFFKGITETIWINNVSSCTFYNLIPDDNSTYSTTCSATKTTFTMTKYYLNTSDNNTVWFCQMKSIPGGNGSCVGTNNSCTSGSVTLHLSVNNTTKKSDPSNDNNTKNIIGGAVGGSVGGVALLAVAAYGCYKYKEKKKNGKAAEGKDHEAQNDEGKNGQLKEGTKSKTKESESEQPLVIDNRIGNKDESEIEYVLSKPFDPKERRPLPPLNKELKDKPIHRPQPIPSEKNDVKDQNLRGLSANFEDARGLASETPRPSKLPPIQSTVQEEDTSEEPKKNKKNRKKKNKTDEDKHADE